MSGYFCIAMLEDPPYNMIIGTAENNPDEWLADLPLPSHLLCYQRFQNTKSFEQRFIQGLKSKGMNAKIGTAFSAKAHEVINLFMQITNTSEFSLSSIKDTDKTNSLGEGQQLYKIASNLDLFDPQRIILIKKAAEAGCENALLEAIAHYGRNDSLIEGLKWLKRTKIKLSQAISDELYNGLTCDLYNTDYKPKLLKEWNKAAEEGYADCQYLLAELYYDGEHVTKNNDVALFWYRKAAEQGHEGAQEMLRENIENNSQNDIEDDQIDYCEGERLYSLSDTTTDEEQSEGERLYWDAAVLNSQQFPLFI